jgi:hypothetical protein
MIIFRESVKLEEILQSARDIQFQILKDQMASNDDLKKILTTKIEKLPKYKYLTDSPLFGRATLLAIIDYSIRDSSIESYFIKNSKGIYVGFIAVVLDIENGDTFVNDVKMFSFGLSPKEDEDMIRRDAPQLLDQCLKRFPKVRWVAIKDNKANIAYEIYRRKHNGIRNDLGNKWEYICYGE